jgi:hypothetical protein
MKKIFFMVFVLFVSANSFADTTCNNTKKPLDVLRYMDVGELNLNYCGATKYSKLYMELVKLGEFSHMSTVSACMDVISLTTKVLKREHDEEAPDCNALYPDIMK